MPELIKTFRTLRETQTLVNSLKQSKEKQDIVQSPIVVDDPDSTIIIQVHIKDSFDKPQKFKIYKVDPFKKLLAAFTKAKGLDADNCIMKVFGMEVGLEETPNDYGLAQNNLMEIVVKQDQQSVNKSNLNHVLNVDEDEVDEKENKKSYNRKHEKEDDLDNNTFKHLSTKLPLIQPVEESKAVSEGVKLKVRSGNQEPFKFRLPKDDTFKKLFQGFCTKAGINMNKVKFMFDGLSLDPNSTPADHDMEDEDLIDAIVSK